MLKRKDNMQNTFSLFADMVALLYHEGRNVRHLAKKANIPVEPPFVNLRVLAANRFEAWKQIQPLRRKAENTQTGSGIQLIFKNRFGLTLDEMVVLFGHPSWKGTQCGGNAWLPIAIQITKAGNLLNSGKEDEALQILELVLDSQHNTGKVSDKIKALDKSLL